MPHGSISIGRIGSLVAAALAIGRAGAPALPFQPPARVSETGATAREPSLVVDAMAEPVIAFATAEGIALARGARAFRDPILFPSHDLVFGVPRVARGTLGVLHLRFEEEDPGQPERGREIYATTNPGGQWRVPGNITRNMVDDSGLVSASGSDGRPRFAWTRGGGIILFDDGSGATAVGDGAVGGIATFGSQTLLVFLRGGDVHLGRIDGFLVDPRNLTLSPEVEESSPRIAIARDGTPAIAYARGGEIILRHGSLAEEIVVSAGIAEAAQPSLAFAPDGRLVVAFSADGRIYAAAGDPAALGPPQALGTDAQAASSPAIDVDARGVVHIAFIADGEVHYANDAAPPEPAFELEPSSGERPLRVRFRNRTRGDVRRWLWEFGDGATSAEESPEHVYESAGAFSVTLRAYGPAGREESSTVRDAVLVLSPSNVLRIPAIAAFPGEEGMIIPVIATHPEPIQGFQVAFAYDPAILILEETTFVGTVFQYMPPEFFVARMDPVAGTFLAGLVLDVTTPARRSVAPGIRHHILHLRSRIARSAPEGSETRIEFRNQIGDPPILNIFSSNGRSILPVLESSTVRILEVPFPPSRFFVRGDADGDRILVLSDAIFLLNYQFASGRPPVCIDAADVDDNGVLDIADPIYLLHYLFVYGPAPPYPFPGPGLDPTDDDLPSC